MKPILFGCILAIAPFTLSATTFAQAIGEASPASVIQPALMPESASDAMTLWPTTAGMLANQPQYLSTTEPSPDDLHLSVSIPVWIPALSGKLTIRGKELTPDQDTGDAIDVLKTHLNGAAALHIEVEKSRFGVIADAMYADLRSTVNRSEPHSEAFLKGFIGELDGFYTLMRPDPENKGFGALRVDAPAGMRMTSVRIGLNAEQFDVSGRDTIYDPIIGGRVELGLTSWLSAKFRGDFGGFGITSLPSCTNAYNLDGGLEWHVATWFDVDLGYRWLKYKFYNDSGLTGVDTTLSGPYLALKVNF